MQKIISGIQQVGVGVSNMPEAWKWYRKNLGLDVRVFEDAAEAPLMKEYTGGEVHSRNAAMALNLQGGGGLEIWQFTSREPVSPQFHPELGDTGILAIRIKSRDVQLTHKEMTANGVKICGSVGKTPHGKDHFFFSDPNGNLFEMVEGKDWFSKTKRSMGGVEGVLIGTSSIDKAMDLYSKVLGYDQIEYDETGTFDDLQHVPGGNKKFRRVLLTQSERKGGPFSRLFGSTHIELIQATEAPTRKVFQDRFWGDKGFIHVCFDVKNMAALKNECQENGFAFTVDSENTFDMGEAGGRFSYTEDPDGTLIEFVEAHRIPILKKLGWYINLQKREPGKPLPDWILKAMRFNRVKD